jgi:hypothetical protein
VVTLQDLKARRRCDEVARFAAALLARGIARGDRVFIDMPLVPEMVSPGGMDRDAMAIGGIVFACVFGGALLGMFIRAVLPEHHLSPDSKDLVKLGMGLIGTMAAPGAWPADRLGQEFIRPIERRPDADFC